MAPAFYVVFVTSVFGPGSTGPETYARYLWDGFSNDAKIEFHLVAPVFAGANPHWHAVGSGGNSLDLYRRLARKALAVAGELRAGGQPVILHVNNSNLHASLLRYDGPLWGQVNDYENADLWRRAAETLRRAGVRRFVALVRRRWLERRFLTRQDLSLCNSEYTRTKILDEYRPPHPERVIMLHKAVDVKFFQRPAQIPVDPLSRPRAARRLVFVGADFRRKGLDTLLQAVAMLPSEFDWHLTVVGASREAVMAAFPNLFESAQPRVLFAGALDKEKLRLVLWNSDVFVLPSRAEALGVALLEALAAGLPVVATKVGGIPEIVRDPAAGLLTLPDDPVALAEAMQDIQPWSTGRPAAVENLLDSFSVTTMLDRLRELYLGG